MGLLVAAAEICKRVLCSQQRPVHEGNETQTAL